MREIISKNFLPILLLLVIVILLLQRCAEKQKVVVTEVKRDTVVVEKYYYHDSSVVSHPSITQVIKPSTITEKYIPDSNYAGLRKQYWELVNNYLTTNITTDTLKIDSIGWVTTTDTVNSNKIFGRKWSYNIKEKEITKTITVTQTAKPKNQFYIGMNIQGNKQQLVNEFGASLLFKNKKDQIYGFYSGIDVNGNINFGVSTYWKIKFK